MHQEAGRHDKTLETTVAMVSSRGAKLKRAPLCEQQLSRFFTCNSIIRLHGVHTWGRAQHTNLAAILLQQGDDFHVVPPHRILRTTLTVTTLSTGHTFVCSPSRCVRLLTFHCALVAFCCFHNAAQIMDKQRRKASYMGVTNAAESCAPQAACGRTCRQDWAARAPPSGATCTPGSSHAPPPRGCGADK